MQKGLLDPGDLNMTFSSQVDLDHLIERIAYRQGLGDTLAEGAWRAAKIVGSGAETCAMTVKKNELTATECRSQTNLALGYATAACGPRYDICEHDWDFDVKVGWSHTLDLSRTIGIQERIPMEYLGLDKVRNYKALNTLWSAVDALGLCVFATAPTRIYSLEKMADLFAAITGFEVSSHEIMRLGEMKTIFRDCIIFGKVLVLNAILCRIGFSSGKLTLEIWQETSWTENRFTRVLRSTMT